MGLQSNTFRRFFMKLVKDFDFFFLLTVYSQTPSQVEGVNSIRQPCHAPS